MILYIDTSALIKIYLVEAESDAVREAVATASPLVTAVVAYAEARAALAAAHRDHRLTTGGLAAAKTALAEDWRDIVVMDITERLSLMAGDFAEAYGLRGYDAVHLACYADAARRAGPEPVQILAFDQRLMQAARRLAG